MSAGTDSLKSDATENSTIRRQFAPKAVCRKVDQAARISVLSWHSK